MTRGGLRWPTVLGLVLVVLTFSVVHPLPLLMIPLAMLLVALPPRRPGLLLFAAALGWLSFLGVQGTLWSVERGWALLLGSYFVAAVLVWPGRAFVLRAMAAVAAAAVTAGVLIALWGGWQELDWIMATRYREAAEAMVQSWPGGVLDAEQVVEFAAGLPARLFPGLLAVASMAALGVGWWGYGRLARSGEPLGRLVEFRFPDVLVWVLIAGLALLLVPLSGWSPRLGSNLVFFMGALYALRGLAVLTALVLAAGPQLPVLLGLGIVAVLLYPIVVAGTLLLGVTDTWLDLRSDGRSGSHEG